MEGKRSDRPQGTPEDPVLPEYDAPAGGWGSLKGVARIYGQERPSAEALRVLYGLNKPEGGMCPSCAWAKPAKPHAVEFCENGAKAVFWELTSNRCTPEFFASHALGDLRHWHDHDLEQAGRLTHPMRYDPASDRYLPVSWDDAFAEIGAELKRLRAEDPKSAVFYASGHAGLEASYLYALFARAFGNNNLPQSSNMCHETTSVNLQATIGEPVGTCVLEDFEQCDAMFFFGQNTGTNSPRFLHQLKEAVKRGCRIVTFNPIREKGLLEFADPQNVVQLMGGKATRISDEYFQVRPGGDIAVLAGMMRLVLEAEDRAPGEVLDHAFIETHTNGFDAMASAVRDASWEEIERLSGLTREQIGRAAEIYLSAKNVIGVYGMGLTQHVQGWLNLGMLVNLLLLRGHMGRPGAGISPVRGHSNVQGQRTVGIGEKPSHMPADKLKALFDVEIPDEPGRNAVRTCEGILDGSVKSLVMLGGNLVRALPDIARMEKAWPDLDLTVSIATKLNRTHLTPGKMAYLLPCLGRLDRDEQATGRQSVSVEDSLSHIFGSLGTAEPPGGEVRSEVAIVAGLAESCLPENPKLRWRDWTGNYSLVRDLIEATFPEKFRDFNARMHRPGGFYKGNAARERQWKTASGKAEFTAPTTLSALGRAPAEGELTLITLRSHDQFNTTIYGFSDRLRGLEGSRDVLLIAPREMARLGLFQGQKVSLVSEYEDGVERRVDGLAVTAFNLPNGCVAGYYPELNPLVPLGYHEKKSQTPAYKGTPVRIVPHNRGD